MKEATVFITAFALSFASGSSLVWAHAGEHVGPDQRSAVHYLTSGFHWSTLMLPLLFLAVLLVLRSARRTGR